MSTPMADSPDAVLPCGTALGSLMEAVADGADPGSHARTCPHCQAALARLTRGWGAVRAVADTPLPPPPGLATRVLNRLSTVRGGPEGYVVLPGERGSLRVATRVVAALAQQAASTVADVIVVGGDATPDRVTVDLSVRHDVQGHLLGDRVRATVSQHLREQLGTVPPAVDVWIVDIWRY